MIEFGSALPKRLETFATLRKDPSATMWDVKLEFQDRSVVLPVWRIPIGLPKYRMLNGRTSSLQEEWLATHSGNPSDFFESDPERSEVQKVQHQLLKQLIKEKDLLPYFSKPENKQKEIVILDHNGFIVNGNRRICTWRELLEGDKKQYKYFSNIDAVVLPTGDDKAIDKLEGALQVEKDIKADYSWHALANMMLKRMKLHGLTTKTIAQFYDKTEPDVKNLMDMREYAAQYLKSRGKSGHWSDVTGAEFAFRRMVQLRKQIRNSGEKGLFEAASFAILDQPKAGRAYETIPDIHKYLPGIARKLKSELKVKTVAGTEDGDLLGSDPEQAEQLAIAKAIDSAPGKAAEIIKEEIVSQRFLDQEKGATSYVSTRLRKANTEIQGALSGIKPDTNWSGVAEAVASIEQGLVELKRQMVKRARKASAAAKRPARAARRRNG